MSSEERSLTYGEILQKMRMLKANAIQPIRWHLSSDVYFLLLEGKHINKSGEGRNKIVTTFDLPITTHPELKNYISIE